MDGTILRETLQAILPENVIERLAEKVGVVERNRKREIVKLVYSLVLSAGSDDSGVLAEAMRRYNTAGGKRKKRHRLKDYLKWVECMRVHLSWNPSILQRFNT